jgi:Uma2 family endonuclease
LPIAELMKRHPLLVIEVLSESAAAYDRGHKFALYRSLPSLRELLFVEPERLSVELFRRNDAGQWVLPPAARCGSTASA